MDSNRILLTCVLCGAALLAAAQMQNPNSTNPGMQRGPMGTQPGQAAPMGSQIPDTQTQTQQAPKVPDATLVRDVQQQLASESAFAGVQVAAHNGRVELTGSVPTKEDRKKAKEVAKDVPGVTSVKEHLTVGAPGMSGSPGTMGSPSSPAGPGNSTLPDSQAPQSTPKTLPDSSANPPHAALTTIPTGSGGAGG